jgi:hypothetical protein
MLPKIFYYIQYRRKSYKTFWSKFTRSFYKLSPFIRADFLKLFWCGIAYKKSENVIQFGLFNQTQGPVL